MERVEEMLILSQQLYFANEVKEFPIVSSTRWLLRKGEMTHLVSGGDDGKWTLRKKSRMQIHVFLFTDLLIITKKKR
jgi:SH3 domain-containing guanine exchange factor